MSESQLARFAQLVTVVHESVDKHKDMFACPDEDIDEVVATISEQIWTRFARSNG